MVNRNDAEAVIKETIEYANNEISKNKKKSRRIIITVIVVALIVVVLLGGYLIGYVTFNTGNPFSAASGYFQITVLDKEYVEIQKSPQVILAQPSDEIFIEYMELRGFTELEEEQMGSIRVFSNGSEKELIKYNKNAHCSTWCWQ